MYQMAKSARTKLKNKARHMATASNSKVDSSDWSPAEPLNTEVKTGMRPISPRAYKKGGKVMGEAAEPRADRKARKAGGRLVAKDIAEAKVNRNVKAANTLRPGGKAHVGGYKKGGAPGGDYSVTGASTVTKDKEKSAPPTPPMPPRRPANVTPTFDYSVTGADTVTRDGEKRGGRTKKMFGGPMMGDDRGSIVKPTRFDFGKGAQGTPYKKGGAAAHPDVAEDKSLIKKMVKPSAMRKGKRHGGVSADEVIGYNKAIENLKKESPDYDWDNITDSVAAGVASREADRIQNFKKEHGQTDLKRGGRTKRATGGPSTLDPIGLPQGVKDPLNLGKGVTDPLGIDKPMKTGGRTKRATGGQVFSGPGYPGKIPGVIGGRKAHAAGGKAGKGKTNINIVIAGPKGDEAGMPPKGLPPQLPQRMPVPAPAPSGMPMGAGPAMSPAGMPPMPLGGPSMGAPTPRKSGGRITKVASSYKDMQAGAGSGEGRLQKADIAKARMGRKVGGRAYRSYKDMDAGAGSGEGRLEKTEIQRSKRVH